MSKKIIRIKAVMEKTGMGRSTIYRRVAQKTFPKPIPLGTYSVGWVEAEINEWIDSKISCRDYENDMSRQYQLGL